MKIILLVIGLIIALLGGLWLLQGLGLVHIRPFLCFANCEPIQGPSLSWAIAGAFMAMIGAIAIIYALKGRTRR